MSAETNSAHLSADRIARWWSHTLTAPEILAASEHLNECPQCLGALSAPYPVGAVATSLVLAVGVEDSPHLTPEQLVEWVDGKLQGEDRESAGGHLQSCATCSAEAADLAAFAAGALPKPRWQSPLWLAAAASLTVVLAGAWIMLHAVIPSAEPRSADVLRDGTLTVDSAGSVRGVPEPLRPLVEAMLGGADLVLPEGALDRVRPSETQRAPKGPDPAVGLADPVSKVVLEDRPSFLWQGPPQATYRIEIYDGEFRLLATSDVLRAESWRPAAGLPRGQVLTWKVVRLDGVSETSYPVPPAPPAIFEIVTTATAKELETVHATGSHLLAGLALWRAGATAEAAGEFAALARENPQSALARRLAASSRRGDRR